MERCDPYEQHGYLLVNTTVPKLNRWQPIGAPASCDPIDFMTAILELQIGITNSDPILESLRNRTVLILGDSVDRDHNEDFCGMVGGFHEMIGSTHPLAPPYPKGQEVPPEGYYNYENGLRVWPDNPQSRPFICHVLRLNLRFVNVFHYSLRPYDPPEWISNHAHFYPPQATEDRFDQIVIPLLRNIAREYGTSPVPDVVTISPTYWNMGFNETEWMEKRVETIIRHVGNGWHASAARAPLILWRSMHRMRSSDPGVFTVVNSLDQIGRSVVERMVMEGEAAALGAQEWKQWMYRVASSHFAKVWGTHSVEEVKAEGLCGRLRIDEWGALMLGQESYFKDHLHPAPLPGSYLWGNMVLQQLRSYVEEKETELQF